MCKEKEIESVPYCKAFCKVCIERERERERERGGVCKEIE